MPLIIYQIVVYQRFVFDKMIIPLRHQTFRDCRQRSCLTNKVKF